MSLPARLVLPHLFGGDQRFDELAWAPFREGVEIHRIYGGGEGAPSAAFLRYAPGANVPRHRHTGTEHIIVLSGSQRDDRATYQAGTCVIHHEGTSHGVASDDGCVVLAIWNSPVAFVAENGETA